MSPLAITHFTMTSCLGHGLAATTAALQAGRSGLKPCDFETVDIDTWIGEVEGVDAVRLRDDLGRFDCRNNRLALLGLQQDGFDRPSPPAGPAPAVVHDGARESASRCSG